MKKILTLFLLIIFALPAFSAQMVNGYYRKSTKSPTGQVYVKPYYKSTPDYTKYNNYSTKGNYNPYTGKKGTKNINRF